MQSFARHLARHAWHTCEERLRAKASANRIQSQCAWQLASLGPRARRPGCTPSDLCTPRSGQRLSQTNRARRVFYELCFAGALGHMSARPQARPTPTIAPLLQVSGLNCSNKAPHWPPERSCEFWTIRASRLDPSTTSNSHARSNPALAPEHRRPGKKRRHRGRMTARETSPCIPGMSNGCHGKQVERTHCTDASSAGWAWQSNMFQLPATSALPGDFTVGGSKAPQPDRCQRVPRGSPGRLGQPGCPRPGPGRDKAWKQQATPAQVQAQKIPHLRQLLPVHHPPAALHVQADSEPGRRSCAHFAACRPYVE